MDESEFWVEQLKPYVGYRIDGLAVSSEDDFGDVYVGLILTDGKDRKILWFLRDEEGDGPGAFEILDEEAG